MAGSNDSGPAAHGGGALGAVDRAFFAIEKAMAFISALCIFGLMLIGVWQVLARKLFNAPIYGYIDLVEIAMTTFAFIAISFTERLGGHVRMEILASKMRGRLLWLTEVIGVLIGLFVAGTLAYYSYTHFLRAWDSGDSTMDLELPWWPSKLIVTFAFVLLLIRLLISLWGYLRMLVDPDQEPIGMPVIADLSEVAEETARVGAGDMKSDEGR
ncbi:MAG: TRAP transporter small permease subunit [Hyphomicrobiaceae bacterium]